MYQQKSNKRTEMKRKAFLKTTQNYWLDILDFGQITLKNKLLNTNNIYFSISHKVITLIVLQVILKICI